jgi:hypothetical protein
MLSDGEIIVNNGFENDAVIPPHQWWQICVNPLLNPGF